jgi:apolipoprotein D and lipocalin family protein
MRGKRRGLTRLALPALAVVAASLLLAGKAAGQYSGNPAVPEPLKPVDLPRYLGRWYEFARYDNRFERGCEGVTAEYSRRPDGAIGIVNTCRRGGLGGPLRASSGRARIVPGSGDTKLRVSFFGPVFLGRYWILDHDEDYSWSVVGEPSGKYLWILTREPAPDIAVQELLIARARALGYDTHRLRRTLQPADS